MQEVQKHCPKRRLEALLHSIVSTDARCLLHPSGEGLCASANFALAQWGRFIAGINLARTSGGSMACGVAVNCRTIPSVVRTLGGQAAVNSISTALAPLMQQQHCTVSVLLVMYGLPRLLIGSIVAHELMHAYLRMRHVAGLPLQVRGCVCDANLLTMCAWALCYATQILI